jgi:hypothetical protein
MRWGPAQSQEIGNICIEQWDCRLAPEGQRRGSTKSRNSFAPPGRQKDIDTTKPRVPRCQAAPLHRSTRGYNPSPLRGCADAIQLSALP